MEKSTIETPSVAYSEMYERWDLCIDLMGGTKTMREAGTKWLPQEKAEDLSEYDSRLSRSILFEGYADTIGKLSARPFSHPISVMGLPEQLSYLLNDVDSTGRSLESLAEELLKDLAQFGIAHIFVDHTQVEQVRNGGVATIADEKAAGARVLLKRISPLALIGWQTATVDGKIKLRQIRIKSTEVEADGNYADKEVERIKVWNSDYTWELWEKVDGKWGRAEDGAHTFDGVPLITIYANRKGFLKAYPPLEGLAWLNLAHWQSSSDQRHILKMSRFAILFGKGFPREYAEGKKSVVIGPTTAYITDSETSELKYVEHSGKAIEAGAKDLSELEVKMEILGQQPLVRSQPNSTATGKRIDENRNVSQLQRWIREEEDGIQQALIMACKWRRIDPPKELSVDIYSDFEAVMYGSGDKEHLLKMREAEELSRVTYLKEVKRRGVLADSVDPEEEARRIEDEFSYGEVDETIPSLDGE